MATIRSPRPDGSTLRTSPSADCLSVHALGFRATLATSAEYLDVVANAVDRQSKITLINHNLHSLYLYFRDQKVRNAYRFDPVLIDGMPVVWLLKLARQPAHNDHRVTWMDFFWPLMDRAAVQGWRVFYVGHRETTLNVGLSKVRARLPTLSIAGHDGFFDATTNSPESEDVVRAINAFGADLCLVGMGMPRQELWVAAHRERIEAPVVLTCGACLEYIAGELTIPPRWMGRLGLEWAYQLASNPWRYAGRYLVEPWRLAFLLLRHDFSRRRWR